MHIILQFYYVVNAFFLLYKAKFLTLMPSSARINAAESASASEGDVVEDMHTRTAAR